MAALCRVSVDARGKRRVTAGQKATGVPLLIRTAARMAASAMTWIHLRAEPGLQMQEIPPFGDGRFARSALHFRNRSREIRWPAPSHWHTLPHPPAAQSLL
jgi:hypothetical protein